MSSHNIKGGNLGPILGAAMALGHNCWKGDMGGGILVRACVWSTNSAACLGYEKNTGHIIKGSSAARGTAGRMKLPGGAGVRRTTSPRRAKQCTPAQGLRLPHRNSRISHEAARYPPDSAGSERGAPWRGRQDRSGAQLLI